VNKEFWSKEKQEAEDYAKVMERNLKYDVVPLAKKIIQDISAHDSSIKLADMASGPGFLSIELAKRLPKASITAVDFSQHMNDIAQRKAKENNVALEVIESDVQRIDMDGEQFDVIVSKNTIGEVDNPGLFLQETLRLLKSGGRLFLIDFDGDYPDWKLRPLWFLVMVKGGRKAASGFWESHKTGFKIDDIVRMCKKAGYIQVSAEPYGFSYYVICQKG